MRMLTVTFGDEFDRMAEVLEHSAAIHCPGATFERRAIDPPASVPRRLDFCTYNTRKLEIWRDAVHQAAEPLVLMDADTLILGPLDEAFAHPFDVAYTSRPGVKWLNAGVFYVRPTSGARRFVDAWYDRNCWLMDRPEVMDPRLHQCGGVNQMALMDVLNVRPDGWKIGCLPCARWNCCDQTWWQFDRETRVLHLKNKLRRAALHGERHGDPIDGLAALWNQYAEATGHARVR